MPYVDPDTRTTLGYTGEKPMTPGELNYVLTRDVLRYIEQVGGITYASINEVVGVLECMKLELYRRVAAPYEDHKRDVNGEVFPVQKYWSPGKGFGGTLGK